VFICENGQFMWACDACQSPMHHVDVHLVCRDDSAARQPCYTLHEACIDDYVKMLVTDQETDALLKGETRHRLPDRLDRQLFSNPLSPGAGTSLRCAGRMSVAMNSETGAAPAS
jgi:hypothetical protein